MDPLAQPFYMLVAAAGSLAALTIALAGLAMIIGLRRWSGRLLLLALLFVVIGTMGPAWLPAP